MKENLLLLKVSSNIYIDKLDDIKNKCNHIYHSTIRMKPADVKSSTYADSCYSRHETSL